MPRKSAGSGTRRIASEMALWCMYEVGMIEKEEVFGSNKALGEMTGTFVERCICQDLHNIVFGFGLLSIVKVQLVDPNKILPLLLSEMTREVSHILKHNRNNFTEVR